MSKEDEFVRSMPLMILTIPVFAEISGGIEGKEISLEPILWCLPLGIIFMIVFTRMIANYYRNTIQNMNSIMEELE